MRIAITGSSGFVGTEIARQLQDRGHEVVKVSAPRLGPTKSTSLASAAGHITPSASLVEEVQGCDVLINAAGNPDASAAAEDSLNGPNALLVALLGKLCIETGIPRFIHVSSAVVQGDKEVLDSSRDVDGFSPYARSKIAGEELGLAFGPSQTVIYRPPSVHHESRRVTQQLHRIANSMVSTVASPGDAPTPQVLLESVGHAVSELAISEAVPPNIVHHPWEGLTSRTLLELFGAGRTPLRIPRFLAYFFLKIGKLGSRVVPQLAPYVRRVELVWFGQKQAESWLKITPSSVSGWENLATRVAQSNDNSESN